MKNLDGWLVPAADAESPDRQVNDQVTRDEARRQIELALQHLPPGRRGLAVQGGARCGVWPLVLSEYFLAVRAFEPDWENFRCAEANLAATANARVTFAALSRHTGLTYLRQGDNGGLHYVQHERDSGAPVAALALDDLRLPVDAMFLDVEGYEFEVLRGASETIAKHRPVIVAEENALIERYGRRRGDLEAYLQPFGYALVDEYFTAPAAEQHDGNFRGSDLIFACSSPNTDVDARSPRR